MDRTPRNNERSVGSTIVGGTVSEVVESRANGWSEGDLVVGYYGWQECSVGTPGFDAYRSSSLSTSAAPVSWKRTIFGMAGLLVDPKLIHEVTPTHFAAISSTPFRPDSMSLTVRDSWHHDDLALRAVLLHAAVCLDDIVQSEDGT